MIDIEAFRSTLAGLQNHLQDNPDDTEAAELCRELSEAIAASSTAHQQHAAQQDERPYDRPATPQPQPAANSSKQQQRRQQLTMHPANLYAAGEPDFAALAAAHPALAQHLIYPQTPPPAAALAAAADGSTKSARAPRRRPVIDFTSWEATKELTAALLRADFGVVWDLPAGQLVPPVPNRANYIHWVADLLQLSSPPPPAPPASQGSPAAAAGAVVGLDIGCGANLIYCLLGAAIYGWRMVGVDVTDIAITAAQQLVVNNPQLQGLLEVRRSACIAGADLTASKAHHQQQQHDQQNQQQQQQGVVLGPLMGAVAAAAAAGGASGSQQQQQQQQECFHFCMCNPPFFESLAEANQNPNTACGGTAEEMVVPGGELAFVRAMIADSLLLRGRIHWYTTMCGKKGSMKTLRQELHAAGVTALRTTELVQGKTSRWAIAWSFTVPASKANLPLPRAAAATAATAARPQHQYQQQQQQQQQGVVPRFQSAAASSSRQQQQLERTQAPLQQQQQQRQQQQLQLKRPLKEPPSGSVSQVSFTVEGACAAEGGRRVLQALAALLTSLCGAQQLQLDSAKWVIRCRLPPTQQAGGDDFGDACAAATAAAAAAEQPKAKQARVSGAADVTGAAAGAASAGVLLEVCVFQQRKVLQVVAKEAKKAGSSSGGGGSAAAAAAALLVDSLEKVRADMGLMWTVSEELAVVSC